MHNLAIIQARSTSTRFPRKIFAGLHGKTCLQRTIERVSAATYVSKVAVAVPEQDPDLEVIRAILAGYPDVSLCLGPEDDVLGRVTKALYETEAKGFRVYSVIDITSDCPMVDPRHIDDCIESLFNGDFSVDYASNVIHRCYPDGFDVQVYRPGILSKLDHIVPKGKHRSHTGWNVLQYAYELEGALGRTLQLRHIGAPPFCRKPHWSVTLDTYQDADLLEELYKRLPEDFRCEDVVELLTKHPDLRAINENVERKTPGEG